MSGGELGFLSVNLPFGKESVPAFVEDGPGILSSRYFVIDRKPGHFLDARRCSGLLCPCSSTTKFRSVGRQGKSTNLSYEEAHYEKTHLATSLFVTVCALTQLCEAAQMALKLEEIESYFEAPDAVA